MDVRIVITKKDDLLCVEVYRGEEIVKEKEITAELREEVASISDTVSRLFSMNQ